LNREQSIDLLNATHEFPCRYTFKVIGISADEFVARVVSVVRDEIGKSEDPPYSMRSTPGGRHVSVTLEPMLDSAEQVLAVYQRLGQVTGVVITI
jgi:putative lipoic acid-binding regulatory protein